MRASPGSPGRRRILIIDENATLPFDTRVWQEARALCDAGYSVIAICPKGVGFTASTETIDGVVIYRHPTVASRGVAGFILEYSNALLWELLLAWRVFLTRGFDVIHGTNPPDTIFLVAALFKPFRKRFVFDHHDVCPELFEAKFGPRRGMLPLLRWLERLTFATADVSIATNESYRERAITRGRMDPGDVFVVRTGPDLDRVRPVDPVPALKHGSRHLVGYVGAMGRQEGIDYLLDAAAHIVNVRGRDDVHFTLVGPGSDRSRLEARLRQLGIADHVDFTGFVSDQRMLEILSTADVCVNPDEHNPMNDMSTMVKIMEYMALGKPIVQFDVHEGRVSAQAASLYARPNDAIDLAERILELLDDPDRRAAMGTLGRQRVEQELAWPHEVPKLLDAYTRVFSRASSTGSSHSSRQK